MNVQAIILAGAAVLSASFAAAGDEFLVGADFSHLAFFEQRGITYKENGQAKDALRILKDQGLNCVRLRLFTSNAQQAQSNPYNYINNLDYTVPLAVRAKAAGLRFLLDFHYSDSWADPAKQFKPAAWTNLAFPDLVTQMRFYNSNCIAAFKAAGAMPDYVQVGNEITPGMLWMDGRVSGTNDTATQWQQFRQLLNAAIQGIKDASGPGAPKIMVHIDRGGDWAGTKWFFDHLQQSPDPVSFDLIGESYYSWWHGSLANLSNCLNNAAARYGKPVVVVETAFPWTNCTYDPNLNLPLTTNGQVQYVAALASIVKSVPNGKGAGIFWWGAEYVGLNGYNLADFQKTSFFDFSGNVLPVAKAFGQLSAPLLLNARMEPNRVALEWPFSGAGMSLVTTTGLAPPIVWQPVSEAVMSTGAGFSVSLPLDGSVARFYRLHSN